MTALPAGPRHAAQHRTRSGASYLPAGRARSAGRGAHRAQPTRPLGPTRYDQVILAVAGWLLAARIALVGEHVIEEV